MTALTLFWCIKMAANQHIMCSLFPSRLQRFYWQKKNLNKNKKVARHHNPGPSVSPHPPQPQPARFNELRSTPWRLQMASPPRSCRSRRWWRLWEVCRDRLSLCSRFSWRHPSRGKKRFQRNGFICKNTKTQDEAEWRFPSDTHHAFQNFPEDYVFAVQPRCLDCGDEELGTVCVFAGVGHAEPAGAVVLQLEVLVRETVSIDALAFIQKRKWVLYHS